MTAAPLVRVRIWPGLRGGSVIFPSVPAQTRMALPLGRAGRTSVLAVWLCPLGSVKRTLVG